MAENQNHHPDIEPLDDEALADVAGGSSGGGCSCSACSWVPEPDVVTPSSTA